MEEENPAPMLIPVNVKDSVGPPTTTLDVDEVAQLSFDGGVNETTGRTGDVSGAHPVVSPSSTYSQDPANSVVNEESRSVPAIDVKDDFVDVEGVTEEGHRATASKETLSMNNTPASDGGVVVTTTADATTESSDARGKETGTEVNNNDEEDGLGSSEKRGLLKEGGDGIEMQKVLTEDAYSLLYTADLFSVTTLYALVTILLQAGMLGLTFWDLIKPGNETNGGRNRIAVPPGATPQVMISQFLGMVLTVMVMAADGDFVIGIAQLIEGYDDSYMEKFPNATWYRFLVTAVMQTVSGSFLLIDSFILAMQSSTVIDLSLNLTALYFIQEIDEQAFQLGLTGMIATRIKEDCESVQEWQHETTKEYRRTVLIRKRRLIFFMLVALLIPYFAVVGRQAGGRYVCNNVYIQFGDAFDPKWAHYSGRFKSQGNSFLGGDRKDSRNYYLDEATGQIQLAYCGSEEAWTISLVEREDPCEYVFKSADTDTFDVIEVAGGDWYYNTGEVGGLEAETGDVKVDWMAIICNDCNEDLCNAEYGTCSDSEDRCECKEGRFGLNCEFNGTTCEGISLDRRTAAGLSTIPSASYFLDFTEYAPISRTNITLYDRFIYAPTNALYDYSIGIDTTQVSSYIIFTGRRFVLYGVPETSYAKGIRSNWTIGDFYKWFIEQDSTNRPFDMLKNLTIESPNYPPLLFSSPVNYGGDSYTFEPTGLTWVLATEEGVQNDVIPLSPDDDKSTGAQLLCSYCHNETSPCHNGATCSGQYCVCQDYFEGHLCEQALNCGDVGGFCYNGGTCNMLSGLCNDCGEGTYGRLCQYGDNTTDPYFCQRCFYQGQTRSCNLEDQICECYEGYEGKLCDLPTNSTPTNSTP
ncbi:Notch ligand involved in the mediation of Notch signaling (By similarity) [Seminavis robusta]|uniref:Notch ligand involved in the mediation of Notch signaling By similarity n=1 Tax=Seminavis robusta TaxID=568900 RepID=A0A9N8DFW7_9STRA|nr:Notch ligand involved in the mediation of Notch signaling (By similarity) [Seminavis robusta]|eukprot:Sro73_g040370.1 Notch ligand involved in the mediation of Notch signaling (By similarity) (864) ;mRNA; f:66884-70198